MNDIDINTVKAVRDNANYIQSILKQPYGEEIYRFIRVCNKCIMHKASLGCSFVECDISDFNGVSKEKALDTIVDYYYARGFDLDIIHSAEYNGEVKTLKVSW